MLTFGISTKDGFTTATIFISGKTYSYSEANHHKFQSLLDSLKEYAKNQTPATKQTVINLLAPEFLKSVIARSPLKIENGKIYYGNTPLHGLLVDRILEFQEKGLPYQPYWKFLEKVVSNPSKTSVDHLLDFIEKNSFPPIAPDGDIIAYKAVNEDYTSSHSGYGVVDGVVYEDAHLPNHVGSVVSIPRELVDTNQDVACSVGLHVGSLEYVKSFAPRKLIVKVNPSDVVSVPSDSSYMKIRVCRYEVLEDFEDEIEDVIYTNYSRILDNCLHLFEQRKADNKQHAVYKIMNHIHTVWGKDTPGYSKVVAAVDWAYDELLLEDHFCLTAKRLKSILE